MNFRSFNDLSIQAHKLANVLPQDVELIVGIPRSGLLAANLIALYKDLPFTDIQGLLENRLLGGGERFKNKYVVNNDFLLTPRKVVIIDDSLYSGIQIINIRQKLRESTVPHKYLFAVIFILPGKEDQVDYFVEKVDSPRCFEWNILHGTALKEACVDIDGVLCRDPSEEENDDGQLYEKFLESVEPNFSASYEIGWLVTCRLEKYRELTEKWLLKNGFKYRSLIMMTYPDKTARIAASSYSEFKSKYYQNTPALLFIESSYKQATQIAQITHKPVFCTETWEMINNNGDAINNARLYLHREKGKLLKIFKGLSSFLDK